MSNQQPPKQVRFNDGHKVLQQVNNNNLSSHSTSKVSSAISELRQSFNEKAGKLSSSRVADQLNESVQTIARSPGQICQPLCQPICSQLSQQVCPQMICQPQQQMCCNYQPQAYVVGPSNSNNEKLEKKIKKLKRQLKQEKEQIVSTVAVTPKKEKKKKEKMQDPEIESIKREIIELERVIQRLELQPKQSQQEIELFVEDNKKCLKKMCKKVKGLEKELYDVARQRDEAMIIKTQLERENQEMFDRIGELESILKVADKKVFDLTVQVERQNGYIKQLEDEVERLRRKKKKKCVEVQEKIVEKIVEKPIEVIKNVNVEKRVEVPVEIIKEIPSEPRIVEKVVEVPRIEYVYQQVPQYIETPVVQRVEVPVEVPYEVVRQVPYEVVREVPYEVIKEVPYEVVKYVDVPQYIEVPVERIVEVPVERIVEVPVDRIVEIPVDRYVEVPVDRVVEVPVDRVVEVPVERVVEVPYQIPYEVRVPYEVQIPYERYVEVPYERKVEVPVERIVEVPVEITKWHTDEREIMRLHEENRELLADIGYLRDKLRLEVERSQMVDDQQIEYLRSQVLALEVAVRNAQMESIQWEDRAVKLEGELFKERTIVSDLQNRLDQMYYQVENLTAENNKRNEEFQRYLEKLERRHKKELHRASQPAVVQHYLVDTGAEGHVSMQPLSQNQPFIR